jgi:hypothetical protein
MTTKKVVVVLEVLPRDDDNEWRFFVGTLRTILEKILASTFARRWDYRFRVVSVARVDEEA